MYKVVEFFTDLQDNNHPYHPGEKFPRDGISVTDARLNELSTVKNLQKKVLIKRVVENDVEKSGSEYTKTEIMRMSKADLAKLATEHGFDDAENASGADLKSWLIEKLV